MSFAAAVERLSALGLELAPGAPRRKFELAHMRTLAAALGDPQTKFPSVLIAGTNGKGSTAATLASILAAAGYRTGLYTSPHLERVTERIRFTEPGGAFAEIAEADFSRLYFQVDETGRRLVAEERLPHPPSYFETLTAIAFLYFAERKVDIAVLEVGLGGRLDATNIVDPFLSIITDIALDHQEYLGPTIAAIAREKAGILRPEGTLITLPQHPEANQAIGEVATELGVRGVNAAKYLPGRDFHAAPPPAAAEDFSPRDRSFNGAALAPGLLPNNYDLSADGQILHVRSPLAGEHQQRNIALAIAAAIELRNSMSYESSHGSPIRNTVSYNIPNPAIETGISNTSWPGRLEFLAPNLFLDVAHNPAGAWTLRAALATVPESQPRTLLFSCLRDKDLREMAQILFPLFDSTAGRPNDHIVLVPLDSPRATSLEELLAMAQTLDVPAQSARSTFEALTLARQLTPSGGLIVATGSIYLVGAIRGLIAAEQPATTATLESSPSQ
ncbi:MAG TPA: folylpolyglutamate synthase/dihydrofolate synthase family protein [Acidobacteriaceae bacterium]|nr:folylpolyglutamate synthase/dihydrofolate synthase family protein [Acidobacteriaceae bacterium]